MQKNHGYPFMGSKVDDVMRELTSETDEDLET